MPNHPPPFQERREKPWGFEILYTPPELNRVGKLLFLRAGKRLSLQYHTEKEETIALFSGEAVLHRGPSGDRNGTATEPTEMEVQKGYTVLPGTVHRIEAIEDSWLLEVSSSETGTTARLEDDYQRSDEIRDESGKEIQ